MFLRSMLIYSLILSLIACELGDDGIRYSFRVVECKPNENVSDIEEAARKAARKLDMGLFVGNITAGGSGTAFTLKREDLDISVLAKNDGNVLIYATHVDQPAEEDRELTSKVLASLPAGNCRELESYADSGRKDTMWSKVRRLLF